MSLTSEARGKVLQGMVPWNPMSREGRETWGTRPRCKVFGTVPWNPMSRKGRETWGTRLSSLSRENLRITDSSLP